MIRFRDRLKSLVYRILRTDAANQFNVCKRCKRRKQWRDFSFKAGYLVGYDRIVAEWVLFTEHNFYAKTWAMNGYIVDIHRLTEELWKRIEPLCRVCITEFMKTLE